MCPVYRAYVWQSAIGNTTTPLEMYSLWVTRRNEEKKLEFIRIKSFFQTRTSKCNTVQSSQLKVIDAN